MNIPVSQHKAGKVRLECQLNCLNLCFSVIYGILNDIIGI